MPFGNRISRLCLLVLVTGAIAAPAASAMPFPPAHETGSVPAQDLRGEAARPDTAGAALDLRSEAARDSSDFVAQPSDPAPAKAVITAGTDDGVDGAIVGLIIAGTLALGCALAALALARGPRVAH